MLQDSHPTNEEVLKVYRARSPAAALEELKHRYPNLDWNKAIQIKTKLQRLDEKCKKLKKNKHVGELESVLSCTFRNGESESEVSRLDEETRQKFEKIKTKSIEMIDENKNLKREIEYVEQENENLEYQVQRSERKVDMLLGLLDIVNNKMKDLTTHKQEAYKSRQTLTDWENKYSSLSGQFEEAVEDLHRMKLKLSKQSTRNLNKKLKRRAETIEKKDLEITEKDNELNDLKKQNENILNEMSHLKREKRNLLVKVCRLKKKAPKIVQIHNEEIHTLKDEIKKKEAEIKHLEDSNNLMQDPIIETYYEGKFTDEIRETIMALVTECGVSQKKVNIVMETVVKNLAGKTLSRLPSVGVKSRLLLEAKRVANSHVASTLLAENNTGNTIHQDGTSKFHRHFQGFQYTTSEGQSMSAGISEIGSGDASTIFNEFQHLMSQLSQAFNKTEPEKENENTTANLVSSIIATMSDQGSVNPVFNRNLNILREELLPVAYENWECLTNEEKTSANSLFSFFCKMHIFVNMASEVEKSLAHFEKSIIADGKNPYSFHSTESGTARLVRTVSKALTSHGCEKSGVGGHFDTYLKSKGMNNKLISFRGHRFNHLFHAAGTTFYHLADVMDFLSKWSDPNELLKSVNFDVSEMVYCSGVRALGIIDKIVTGPFWRIIEQAPNSLSLNEHILQLKIMLEAWSKDATPALSGEPIFQSVHINKDCVYEALIAPAENPILDTYTQMALEICFGSMLIILERQAKDQLPGGKYWNLNEETIDKLNSVPTTNTISERDFAQLDILMRAKPSANTTTYESIIMWSNNKTMSWLASLSESEHKSIMEDARKNAPKMKEMVRERQKKLYEKKLEILKQRQEKKSNSESKQQANKIKLTQKLTEMGGLWITQEDVDINMKDREEQECKEAIICQLQFRKHVLQCKAPKEYFQQQLKGRIYTTQELAENLKMVLNLDDDEEVRETTLTYRQTEEVDEEVGNLKKKLRNRIDENRKKIIVSQQKELLPQYIMEPEKIVGKTIKHKCREEGSSTVEWFSATVLNIRKNDGKKTEYTIKYEDDEDEWFFPLLRDMEKGDVIICV